MKTIEEKAIAYDEAIKRASNLHKDAVEMENNMTTKTCEIIFPELAESEDERIRKSLIDMLKNDEKCYLKEIAWLEKQGEERKITHEEICKSYGIPDIGEFSDGYHTFNGLYKQRMILFAVLVNTYKDRAWKSWKHEDGLDCFGGGWFIVGIDTPAGSYTYHYEAQDWDKFDCQVLDKAKHWDGHDESDVERLFSLLEKQGEQKPTDRVEPKFKTGDWIIQQNIGLYKVIEICESWYEVVDNTGKHYSIGFDKEHMCRPWTIQDAKDGDVLVCESGKRTLKCLFIFKLIADREVHEYCSYRIIDKHFSLKDSFLGYVDNVYHPATKEQRDTLMKAMANAGYTFDFEKKELKKL